MTTVGLVRIPDSVVSLEPYVRAGVLGPGEVHFAAWVVDSAGCTHPSVALGAAITAWAATHGHSCVDLEMVDRVVARDVASGRDADSNDASVAELPWPSESDWVASLRAAGPGVVRVVESWDSVDVLDTSPLVLKGSSLHLQRYWIDECKVAMLMRARAVPTGASLSASAAALLDRLLPAAEGAGAPNLQRVAAQRVVDSHLTLVAGGPGTGKTYSVARLLAVLLSDAQERGEHLRIAVAAPTGKAAARLRETILGALEPRPGEAPIESGVADALRALQPTTIHRLLGSRGVDRQRFRHDAAHPLPHDVVVIDETSMVSLPLLSRLAEAVRPEARFVLIGDPDQLESVELGAVLGDLVKAPALAGCAVRLQRVYRTEGDSPVALLSDAVRSGNADAVMSRLALGSSADVKDSTVRFIETDDPRRADVVGAVGAVMRPILQRVRDAAVAGDAAAALAASIEARVLCAHREGPFGVSEWNQRGEAWLRGESTSSGAWYAGRPLLITRNDARLGLANGDTGVVVEIDGRLTAVFAGGPDTGPRLFDPVQLESVETAYAMTVHKSQGSEYPSVMLVLPPASSPLVGRELVYTGITRTKAHLLIVGSTESMRRCVESPARRMTGLAGALS
jgi:exodeoxyribonuclease V alpha subunit